MSDPYMLLRLNESRLKGEIARHTGNAARLYHLRQRLADVRRRIGQRQVLDRHPQARASRGVEAYAKIEGPERMATRFRNIDMVGYSVEMRRRPQPPQILQRIITELFHRFIGTRSPPYKIALGFRLLPHGDNFFVPLRPPALNTYALLAREVERNIQSEDPTMNLQGLRLHMKLSGQWLPSGSARVSPTKLRNEIDVSQPSNSFCLPVAILAGVRKCSWKDVYAPQFMEQHIQRWASETDLEAEARQLLTAAGIPTLKSGYDTQDVARIEAYLATRYPQTYRIVVAQGSALIHVGPPAKELIPLRLHNNHFTLLKSLPRHFGYDHYCVDCKSQVYRTSHNKECNAYCTRCFRYGFGFPCVPDGLDLICDDCGRRFLNEDCFQFHRLKPVQGEPICKRVFLCACGRINNSKFKHNCAGTVVDSSTPSLQCERCLCEHDPEHPSICYIPQLQLKDSHPVRFVFFDAETVQEKALSVIKHECNLIIAHAICASCMDAGHAFEQAPDPADARCVCPPKRRHVFQNFDRKHLPPAVQFLDWMGIKGRRKMTVIALAHNSAKFDSHIIYEAAIESGLTPKVTTNGLKLIRMKISGRDRQTVLFIDSYLFFAAPLSKLPKTFGLAEDLSKQYFPHFFNRQKNLNRKLKTLPPIGYYGCKSMSPVERDKFIRWYTANRKQPFHLRKSLVDYCEVDVRILREACTAFRKELRRHTGLDPFTTASTIAKLTVSVFQHKFLPERTLVSMPELGYRRNDVQSQKARQWLRWYAETEQVRVRSCESAEGECCVQIQGHKYKPDGLVLNAQGAVQEILEFNGCFWHAHTCLPDREERLFDGRPAEHVYAAWEERRQLLEQHFQAPMRVEWECEWDKRLEESPETAALVQRLHLVPTLNPRRDCLFGGRTEPFSLIHDCAEDEEMVLCDVTSLYPKVMADCAFPLGHPRIWVPEFESERQVQWTRPEDVRIRGLLNVTVQPPTRLLRPLLPYRSKRGTLIFGLCRTCAEEMPLTVCAHAPTERQWTAAYCSEELKHALRLGYKVVAVHETWEWTQWAEGENSLFKEFVRLFLKLKVTNSGWPKEIANIEDANERVIAKLAYLTTYKEREGIDLVYPDIQLNEAQRYIAKLLLNSLWGKFCQKTNTSRIELVRSQGMLDRLLADADIEITDISPVTEEILRITLRNLADKPQQAKTNSVPIGCFVTSYARLHLYSFIEKCPAQCLYTDTDSLLVLIKRGAPLPFTTGSFLGEMSVEHQDWRITGYCSAGPKNYGMLMQHRRTGEVRSILKIRGFRQTFTASEILKYETVKQEIIDKVEQLRGMSVDATVNEFDIDREPNILTVCYTSITRDQHGGLFTKLTPKVYKFSYNKGCIRADYSIVPYGYREDME